VCARVCVRCIARMVLLPPPLLLLLLLLRE
jgi:hypothetical protein